MSDLVAEVFGYIILLVAVGLLGWEIYVYQKGDAEAEWLQTPRRFKRRIFMAFLLLCVGALILAESHGLLLLDNVPHLLIYIGLLGALAILLFILSIRDMGDMARSAERYAVEDLKNAIEEQKRQAESSSEYRE